MSMSGAPYSPSGPRDAVRAGIGFVSEDRKGDGIIPDLSVRENLTLAALPALTKYGIVSKERQAAIVDRYMTRLGIKASSADQKIRELSGGNQQKVLLARWLCTDPRLLILDEPTRGIDIGAKGEIQRLVNELAASGLGVLMISSELEELVEGCSRVVVLRDGWSVTELRGEEISEHAIIHCHGGRRVVITRRGTPVSEFAALGVLIVLVVVNAVFTPHFAELSNLWNVLFQVSTVLLAALGMTFVIATGGVDLSVGSVMAISAAIAAVLMERGVAVAVIAALIGATLVGVLNGAVIASLRVQTHRRHAGPRSSVGRGLAQIISNNGELITVSNTRFLEIGRGYIGPVPIQVLLAVAAVGAAAFALRSMTFGRYVLATGGNPIGSAPGRCACPWDTRHGVRGECLPLRDCRRDHRIAIGRERRGEDRAEHGARRDRRCGGRRHGAVWWPRDDRRYGRGCAAHAGDRDEPQHAARAVRVVTRDQGGDHSDCGLPPAAGAHMTGAVRLLRSNGAFVALLAACIVGVARYEAFLTTENLSNVVRQNSMLGLVALGMTFVILGGGIDLSVGALVAVAGVVAAMLAPRGAMVAIAGGIGTSALLGLVNGLVITKARIQPFITTLAMLIAARGAALAVTAEQSVSFDASVSGLTWLGRGSIGPVATPIVILLIAYAAGFVVLRYTRFGRSVYAIGDDLDVARLMGLRTDRVVIGTYALSGALSGLAGVVLAARLGAGLPVAATGWELDAIASVVVGGTLLTGGEGSVGKTFVGVLLLGVIFNLFNLDGTISPWWQWVLRGGFLLMVVIIQSRAGKGDDWS